MIGRLAARHVVVPDVVLFQAAIADLDVRRPDMAYRQEIGRARARAVGLMGWSHKEAAAAIGVDDSEFGKWISGERRAHTDRIRAVRGLYALFLQCQAEEAAVDDPDVEVVTEVRIRRVRRGATR